MRAISECIYERGKHGIKYVRRRIPAELRVAYPSKKTHIVRSLRTADLRKAKARAHAALAQIEQDFESARRQFGLNRSLLPTGGESGAPSPSIMDAGDFDACLKGLQEEFGRLAPMGWSQALLPALRDLLSVTYANRAGLARSEEPQRAIRALLGALSATFESIGQPQRDLQPSTEGRATPVVAAALPDVAEPTWDTVFNLWRDFVENRPRSTSIAAQTPWRDLRRFMDDRGQGTLCASPAQVTPRDMTAFAQAMRDRGLAVDTINERIFKIRAVFKIAVGRHVLFENPALDTLGFKENTVKKRTKRRLPFDASDLNRIFGSEVYTEHKRSSGQSGEASYWIPLLMYYTGARPEEVAGIAINDAREDPKSGWYFDIIDRPSDEDRGLFEDDVPVSHRRTLKNAHSVRRVPVAQQLIDLGLLRYIEWLRGRQATVLFPGLSKDWHGKLSGAFSKFFGRYKRAIGLKDSRKVLYSFRHTMKDLLEAAGRKRAAIPS